MSLHFSLAVIFSFIVALQAQAESFWQTQPQQKDPVQELIDNPYSQYYSKKDIDRAVQEMHHGNIIRSQLILVDTRDKAACGEIQQSLRKDTLLQGLSDLRDLCSVDSRLPIASVMIVSNADYADWQKEISFDAFSLEQKNFLNDARNLALEHMQNGGIIYLLPSSIREWSAPRQVKKQPGLFAIQRHDTSTPLQGFGNATMSVTFFWELRNQDGSKKSLENLLRNSRLGSLFYEVAKNMNRKYQIQNDGSNSQSPSGNLSMIFLGSEPGISDSLKKAFEIRITENSRVRILTRKPLAPEDTDPNGLHQEPTFNYDKNEGLIDNTVNALNQYFFQDMYLGLELQLAF